MPAEEFDAYLKTLRARLRLKPGRRAELEDEFRDHLESRLEELTAAGVPRAAAIQRALEEFGDAAGLASQMSHAFRILARRRRRKTFMRVTASAAATLACGIAVAYLFAPPNRAFAPPGPAVAQDADAPPPENDAADADAPERPDPAAALEAKLDGPAPENLYRPGTPVESFFANLRHKTGIPVLADNEILPEGWGTLTRLGLPPNFNGLNESLDLGPEFTLRQMLNTVLGQFASDLRVENRDGILYVTGDFPRRPGTRDLPEASRLEEMLEVPTTLAGLRPGDTVAEALDTLAGIHQIAILPDSRALDLEGIDLRDLPIDNPPQLSGYSLRTTLDVLLSTVSEESLLAVPRDGILFITTQEAAGLDLETRIYNVRDLLTDVRTSSGGMGGGFGGGEFGGGEFGGSGGENANGAANDLVAMILSVTGGSNFGGGWMETGEGEGSLEHFNGLLAVRQTTTVHRQIEDLLSSLRRSAAERSWDEATDGAGSEAASLSGGADADPVIVVVGPNGIQSINGREEFTPGTHGAYLTKLAQEAPRRSVVIKAVESAPSRVVQEAVKLVTEAGLSKIALRATPDPSDRESVADPSAEVPGPFFDRSRSTHPRGVPDLREPAQPRYVRDMGDVEPVVGLFNGPSSARSNVHREFRVTNEGRLYLGRDVVPLNGEAAALREKTEGRSAGPVPIWIYSDHPSSDVQARIRSLRQAAKDLSVTITVERFRKPILFRDDSGRFEWVVPLERRRGGQSEQSETG
ncbi:permease prefix domain 1-containing protein [Alienimonas chondri]|uniref:Uncharacterized protein n=1 Tax=Alienimonas chondri TaxID=2681879 RepID=A0ABX1VKY7_9PLAN|nr:permease prefix domain 1-containing protein [Alienimonas chondri]NNJ27331.1 hypothetical protein [Alienimonas chondri]